LDQTLTLAATTAYAADSANAQKADPKLKVALITTSPTPCRISGRPALFSKVFNLEQANFKDNELAVRSARWASSLMASARRMLPGDIHHLPHDAVSISAAGVRLTDTFDSIGQFVCVKKRAPTAGPTAHMD